MTKNLWTACFHSSKKTIFSTTLNVTIRNDYHIYVVINDEELKRVGMFDPDTKLYDVDEDLLYFRGKDKPKAPKMNHFEKEKWHNEEYIATPGGIGSNCWTVSGKLT
jgi:hypothetical protein